MAWINYGLLCLSCINLIFNSLSIVDIDHVSPQNSDVWTFALKASIVVIPFINLNSSNIIPKLVAILIGENPASQIYVNSKTKFFAKNNCDSETFKFDSDISENKVLN